LKQGANINKEDSDGRTPLFISCNKSIINEIVIKYLVEQGVDINKEDNDEKRLLI